MPSRQIVGWREWVALPDLGLPAVEAKVDTGAQTSALHAFALDAFEEDGRARVCFGVHPLAGNEAVEVYACADVVDERIVASSSGHEERRVVIRTPLRLGDAVWPIELTLTNRRTMAFRMLLGREAFGHRLLVDAGAAHLAGRRTDPEALYT
ncbi:MAG: RimK/LysX family protein [Bacteroidota bacterium]